MENSTEGLQAVVFRAGETAFGADIRDVREIIKLDSVTAIPGASEHMEGIINVRGEIVPLMSLRSMTGAPRSPHDRETRVLILDCKPPLGLIVDMVGEVKTIPGASIEPMPSISGAAAGSGFYRGIAKLQDRMIILMDLKKIAARADDGAAGCTAETPVPAIEAPATVTTETPAAPVAAPEVQAAPAVPAAPETAPAAAPEAPAGQGSSPADKAYITTAGAVKLTEFQMDAIRELGNIGTSHAATALSQLVNRDIHIMVPAISLEHIDMIPTIVSNDKVVGLLLEIKDGEKTMGYLYTIFSEKSASNIVSTLLGQPAEAITSIGEMEQSAIMEVGNILASSFCDAIAEFLGIVLLPSPPNFVNDMVSAIIQSSLIEISMIADDAILFRTDFADDQSIFDGYVILLPNPDMLERMLSILDAKVSG